ncbi:MAG: O-antigen ligase family protein [Bacteroidetes bacterium]|nr:O-antigen ligase family protein [Bacteroidota bacterium]
MKALTHYFRQPIRLFYLIALITITLNVVLLQLDYPMLGWLLPIAILLTFSFLYQLDYVFFFTVFATPLAVNIEDLFPQLSLSIPTEPLLAALLLIFVLKLLMRQLPDSRIFKHPIVILAIVNLVWMVTTSITSELPLVSFKHLIARLWFVVPMLFMGTALFSKLKNIKLFYWLYIIAFIIVIVNTSINHAAYGFSEKGANWSMAPFFNDHTAYGVMLAFFIPILAGFSLTNIYRVPVRWVSFLLLILFSIALLLSYCRAAWFSVAVSAMVFLLIAFRIRLKWIVLAGFIVIGGFYTYQQELMDRLVKNKQESSANYIEHIESISNVSSDASNLERINRWHSAIRLFSERPNLGWGPGTYQFVYGPYQQAREKTIISTDLGERGNAHSEYLGPLAESGWPGLLGVLVLFSTIVFYGIKVYQKAALKEVRLLSLFTILSLITYFAHGFMNNFLDTDKSAIPFWGFTAIITALDLYHKD